MVLEPLPTLLQDNFDADSLIYNADDTFYYNNQVNGDLVDDIQNHNFQFYSAYYHFNKGWDSPKIYLLGRGKKSGKTKVKITNFFPYCYIDSSVDEYKSYLGKSVEKVIFKKSHPTKVKWFRENRRRSGYPLPYEADILFCRRAAIDSYDFFKPHNQDP